MLRQRRLHGSSNLTSLRTWRISAGLRGAERHVYLVPAVGVFTAATYTVAAKSRFVHWTERLLSSFVPLNPALTACTTTSIVTMVSGRFIVASKMGVTLSAALVDGQVARLSPPRHGAEALKPIAVVSYRLDRRHRSGRTGRGCLTVQCLELDWGLALVSSRMLRIPDVARVSWFLVAANVPGLHDGSALAEPR